MIFLPPNLRSLVIANCLGRRRYAAAAFAQKVRSSENIARALASRTSTSSGSTQSNSGHAYLRETSLRESSKAKSRNNTPQRKRKRKTGAGNAGNAQNAAQTGGLQPVKLDTQTLRENRDARTDIYNFAALLGLIPQFEIFRVPAPKARYQPKALTKVTIRLPEQGIETSAAAHDGVVAEVTACMEFKREVENLFKGSSGAGGVDEHAIPCLQVLSTETSSSFIEYLQIVKKNQTVRIQTEPIMLKGMGDITQAWVTVDGQAVGPKVQFKRKKDAQDVAGLAAAVQLYKEEPELLENFYKAMHKGKGKIMTEAPPVYVDLPRGTVMAIEETLRHAKRAGLPDTTQEIVANQTAERYRHSRRTLAAAEIELRSKTHAASLRTYLHDPQLEQLRNKKQALPMNQYGEQVLEMINDSIYSIVVGATGSGKTTQVPQILFDDAIKKGKGGHCDIVCTQPRRIAATSVAQRVAAERNEKLGQTVGYHVRFDRRVAPPGGSINFCTTGILLEMLKNGSDEVLDSISHLVIDEVHERDLNIDFLMIILKNAIRARQEAGKSVPKIVLMSATLDTELFANYFNESSQTGDTAPCPSISVPGRTFPVKEMFLSEILSELQQHYTNDFKALLSKDSKSVEYIESEKLFSASNMGASSGLEGKESVVDWKRRAPTFENEDMPGGLSAAEEAIEALIPSALVAATLAHICRTSRDGAVLVFLPGLAEIQTVQKILESRDVFGVDFRDTDKFRVSCLHSTVPKEEQAAVFNEVPPGCRKIILATNIAETSVTIPDVQYVVDTGKMREKRYNQVRRISKLQCTWVSKSNSKQRAGRAGRVQNGNYYALFSRERFEMLRTIGLPELLRSDLQETCLATKVQEFKGTVADFLGQAIEPPSAKAVEVAVESLKGLEAFTEDEELTPLGRLLAKLPVHPTLGKMIMLGVIFRCLDPLLVLGAAAAERSMLLAPPGQRATAQAAQRPYHGNYQSDHITLLNVFQDIRNVREKHGMWRAQQYCHERFIHWGVFKNISSTAEQIHDILVQIGLVPRKSAWGDEQNLHKSGNQYGHPDLNRNANNPALIRGLILSGFYPNVAYRIARRQWRTASEHKIIIHQSSVNAIKYGSRKDTAPDPISNYALSAFGAMGQSEEDLHIRDTTIVSPLTAMVFGGQLKPVNNSPALAMDNWLQFSVRAMGHGQYAATQQILELKAALCGILSNAFQSLSNLQQDSAGFHAYDKVRDIFAEGLVTVLNSEGSNRMVKSYSSGDEGGFDAKRGNHSPYHKEVFGNIMNAIRDDAAKKSQRLYSFGTSSVPSSSTTSQTSAYSGGSESQSFATSRTLSFGSARPQLQSLRSSGQSTARNNGDDVIRRPVSDVRLF